MESTLSAREISVISAVVEHGSLTSAARHLGVSQPSVSQTLSDVEAATGLHFFLRKGRSVEATAVARLIAREGVGVARALDRVARKVEALCSGASDHLTIAAMPAFAESFVAEAVARFSRDNPGVACELQIVQRAALEDGLVDGFYDIAVGTLPLMSDDVTCVAVKSAEISCVMPPNHPLAGRDRIALDDLAEERLLQLTPGSPLRSFVDEHIRLGLRRSSPIIASTQHALVTMVMQGAGIAIIDPLNLTRLERQAVSVRPLEPALFYRLGIMRRQEGARSPAHEALLASLGDAIGLRAA